MSSLRDDPAMTRDAFVAFVETRPDDERWELLDGEPILNPSPSYGHQKVVGNLFFALKALEGDAGPWEALPGLGVILSDRSLPVPDVLIRPSSPIRGHFCDDVIVAFEVLSPSSRQRDLRWKRRACTAVPTLAHYVVLQQDRVEGVVYSREQGWSKHEVAGSGNRLVLEGLGIDLPLGTLYRGTVLV